MSTLDERIEAVRIASTKMYSDKRRAALDDAAETLRRLDPEKPENVERLANVVLKSASYKETTHQLARAILLALTGGTP